MVAQQSPGTLARAVALDLLATVLRQKRPLDDALASHTDLARLEARDRGFARNLVATTLRRLGQIDALIGHALERPLPKKAQGVMDVLRLGACQLLFLDTPPHAAVDTMVNLAQEQGMGPHKKLVNAVLRRFAREGKAFIAGQDAARLNTPDWLWRSWAEAYGEDDCRAVAEAHLSEAPLDITVKGDAAIWAEKLNAEILPTGTLRRPPGGPVRDLAGFAEGAWWVQDAAAALPVRLLGDIKGKTVIDLCAAPGGKTAQLAALGAIVTAVDRSEKRLERLTENLARLRLNAETVAADAGQWRPGELADAALVDAPCSSTGTIRRHPDIAHLKAPDDVAKLSILQEKLLAAAFDMVRPGGLVVYCSCSLQPEEGPDRIKALLKSAAPAERVGLEPQEVGGLAELITGGEGGGDLRTLPGHLTHLGGMDGFFAARLKRKP